MKMIRTIGAFLFAANAVSAITTEIASLADLNKAFDDVTSHTIGFLSEANYKTVQSLLPEEVGNGGKLVVKIYADLQHLEDAVVNGSVIAGLTTYSPEDATGKLNVFGTGRITPQSAFFKPGNDGDAMKKAFDAALVRVINSGDHKTIRDNALKNGWAILQVDTCSNQEDHFPFPALANLSDTDVLKGVIDRGVLRVSGLGPVTGPNWGIQGNWQKATPSGFWPEYEAIIYQKIIDQYPLSDGTNLTVEHVWADTSLQVMDSVLAGDSDMTAPYMIIAGSHNDTTPRHYKMEVGCTAIGAEQQFFTLRPTLTQVQAGPAVKVTAGLASSFLVLAMLQ